MEWLQITVATTSEFSDIVSLSLIESGSEGVNIVDYNDIRDILSRHNWDYADETLLKGDDGRVFVKGFFPKGTSLESVLQNLDNYKKTGENMGSLEVEVSTISSQDWENEWKKYYSPIEIGGVVIVPEWIKRPKDDKKEVRIDPGMAFGTGGHDTTALCISLMQDFDLVDKLVADVGCGSGILGIAALKLGAKNCTFVDIDPLAVDATKSNCELNDITCGAKIFQGNLLDGITQKLDFVVANITADILLILLPQLRQSLGCGAHLVISGIINARADEVLAAFTQCFKLLKVKKSPEWQAFSFENR